MTSFKAELPTELIKEFNQLEKKSDDIFKEMVEAGTNVIFLNIKKNMTKSFKSTNNIQKGLVKAKVKDLKNRDGFGSWVGFVGYTINKRGKKVPIPLIVMAREYGTSRGEKKKPFLRKSVNKAEVEQAMLKVQNKYIGEE